MCRKGERKTGAFSQDARADQFSLVAQCNFSGDGQSQAGTGAIGAGVLVIETVKNMGKLFRGNTTAVILNADNAPLRLGDADRYAAALWGEFDGVVQQDGKKLAQAPIVAQHGARGCVAAKCNANSFGGHLGLHEANRLLQNVDKIDRLQMDLEMAVFEPGELQQVVDQALHVVGICQHLPTVGAFLFGISEHPFTENFQ